jgi:hypothetical protein
MINRGSAMAMDPTVLASAAVPFMAPYLAEGGKEVAKRLGQDAGDRIAKLCGRIKAKLTGLGADAVADLEKQPGDSDSQAALRVQLKKALEADPAFWEEVQQLIGEIQNESGANVNQLMAKVTGDRNVTKQVSGSGNVVS